MTDERDAPGTTPPADAAEAVEGALQALRHRLRNAFAVSGAMTLASAREAPAHQEFAAALAQRFATLSLVQSRLLDGGADANLPQLAAEVTQAYAVNGAGVRLAGLPAVTLHEQQARLVALVLGELCAHSLSHGALAGGGASAVLSGSLADATLTLEWSEPPLRDAPGTEADEVEDAGRRLLVRLARAHGAALTWDNGDTGLHARLDLPLA